MQSQTGDGLQDSNDLASAAQIMLPLVSSSEDELLSLLMSLITWWRAHCIPPSQIRLYFPRIRSHQLRGQRRRHYGGVLYNLSHYQQPGSDWQLGSQSWYVLVSPPADQWRDGSGLHYVKLSANGCIVRYDILVTDQTSGESTEAKNKSISFQLRSHHQTESIDICCCSPGRY